MQAFAILSDSGLSVRQLARNQGWERGYREVTARAVSVGSDLPTLACTHRRAA